MAWDTPSVAGDIDAYIGTTMDITERKRSEHALRIAQADLTRVMRLTTMGELTASIAHEINQPLGAIVANGNACLRWLTRNPPQVDEARRAAERIVKDGHRAGDIIKSVRALLGTSAPDMTRFDVNDAIREILVLTRSELHLHNVVIETALADSLPPIMGDRVRLQQVVLNLVMNAIEAMIGTISASRVLRVQSRGDEPDTVLVSIADSGPGIAPEIMDRLFEAFLRRSQAAWAWDFRSAARSSMPMAVAFGYRRGHPGARSSNSPYQSPPRAGI
jgi:C4-dicarboxylate-specific signal transduction histidine kinase